MSKITKKFECCLPVRGTRGYHRYVSISDDQIRCFTSKASNFDEHQTSICFTNVSSSTNNDFVACIYEEKWRLGRIEDRSQDKNDVLMPCGPKTAFQLSKNDTAWVPAEKIIRKLTPSKPTSIW